MINYSLVAQKVATGSSYSAIADDEHAKIAVQSALTNIQQGSTVGSVLLFLSSAYAHAPQNAIKQAAKAAGTPQIFGCCALNLLTEEEWLMDVEGAVAMVFPNDLALQPFKVLQRLNINPNLVLTLTSPNAAAIAINSTDKRQIGALSSDEYGHGPFSVWQSGRIEEHEFSLSAFPNTLKADILVADGIRPVSANMQINLAESRTLKQVNQQTAFASLPSDLQHSAHTQPYNLLCAVSETNDVNCLALGHFELHHVVCADLHTGEIQLTGHPKAGHHLFWAVRDPIAAEQSMRKQLSTLKETLDTPPLFALMFPNLGRGPEFFNGTDKDLECFQNVFSDTPLIGFYGNGEISPGLKGNATIKHYSTVIAVYSKADL